MINLENARNKGYSDEDILIVLKKEMPDVNFDKAFETVPGITLDEIVAQVNKREPAQPQADISDKLYSAFEQAETGPYEDKWIRTNVSEGPVSTAYGPVQITRGLADRYAKNVPELFDEDEKTYLERFVAQGDKFLKNTEGQYGFGGSGELTEEADKAMYKQIAKKMMKHHYDQAGGGLDKTWRMWRFGPEGGEDPRYQEEFTKAFGKAPAPVSKVVESERKGMTPAQLAELRSGRRVTAKKNLFLDPLKLIASSAADIIGSTAVAARKRGGPDAAKLYDSFFNEFNKQLSEGKSEQEAFDIAKKGKLIEHDNIDDLVNRVNEIGANSERIKRESIQEGIKLKEEIQKKVPAEWRARAEELQAGDIIGVDEGALDEGLLNAVKESAETIVSSAIANSPRTLRALPFAALRNTPAGPAAAVAGYAMTTAEMEGIALEQTVAALDAAGVDYDIDKVNKLVEDQALVSGAMEYADDALTILMATGLGKKLAKSGFGKLLKKEGLKVAGKLLGGATLEGLTEVGQGYTGDYYAGLIAKDAGMTKEQAKEFVSTLSEPKAKAFALGFGSSLLTMGAGSFVSNKVEQAKQKVEPEAEQVVEDVAEVRENVVDEQIQEEIRKIEEMIAEEEVVREEVVEDIGAEEDIESAIDAEGVLSGILADEEASDEAKALAQDAMDILQEEIEEAPEKPVEAVEEVEATQTTPEPETALETDISPIETEIEEAAPTVRELEEGFEREERLIKGIEERYDADYKMPQAAITIDMVEKMLQQAKLDRNPDAVFMHEQIKDMILHRDHMENLRGQPVTQQEAEADWVRKPVDEKKSLAEMYRERHDKELQKAKQEAEVALKEDLDRAVQVARGTSHELIDEEAEARKQELYDEHSERQVISDKVFEGNTARMNSIVADPSFDRLDREERRRFDFASQELGYESPVELLDKLSQMMTQAGLKEEVNRINYETKQKHAELTAVEEFLEQKGQTVDEVDVDELGEIPTFGETYTEEDLSFEFGENVESTKKTERDKERDKGLPLERDKRERKSLPQTPSIKKERTERVTPVQTERETEKEKTVNVGKKAFEVSRAVYTDPKVFAKRVARLSDEQVDDVVKQSRAEKTKVLPYAVKEQQRRRKPSEGVIASSRTKVSTKPETASKSKLRRTGDVEKDILKDKLEKNVRVKGVMSGFVDNVRDFINNMNLLSGAEKAEGSLFPVSDAKVKELRKKLRRDDVETILELRKKAVENQKRRNELEKKDAQYRITTKELMELEDLRDDAAELVKLEKEVPSYMVSDVRTISTKDQRGIDEFMKMSPDQVREWLVDVMNAPAEIVGDMDGKYIEQIHKTLGQFYGMQGLKFTKGVISELTDAQKAELSGKNKERARSAEKVAKLDDIRSGIAEYNPKDDDHVRWVSTEMVRIDDDGILRPGKSFEKTYKRLEQGTLATVEFTEEQEEVVSEQLTGTRNIIEDEVTGEEYYANPLDPEAYTGWSTLESATDKEAKYRAEIDKSRLLDSPKVKAKSVASPAMMRVLDYINRNEKQRPAVRRVVNSIYKSMRTDGTIPVELVRQIPMAADNVDFANIPSKELKSLIDATFKVEQEIETKFGKTKLDSETDVRNDINTWLENGTISEGAAEQMYGILDAMGFDPTVLLKQGRKSFYDLSTRVINIKQVEDFSHEASHWAYYNLLDPKERRDYKLSVLEKYSTKEIVPSMDQLKMRENIRRQDVVNATDNFSEFFAEQSGEMINNGEFRSDDKWYDKVRRFFVRMWNSLMGRSYTDPFVRDYWNAITKSGKQLKELQGQRRVAGLTSLSAADLFEDNNYDGVSFDLNGADFLKDFSTFEIREDDKVSEKFQNAMRGIILARDFEKVVRQEATVQEAQALFIDYAIRMLKKGDVRKNLFKTVKNIEKVGDKNWNNAVKVVGGIIESRKRNERITNIQKNYKKLQRRELQNYLADEYRKTIRGIGMKKLTEKSELKLNDIILDLSAIDKEDMTPKQIERLADARARLEANPLADMSLEKLNELDEKLNSILKEDIEAKKEIAQFGKAKREFVQDVAKESAEKYNPGIIARGVRRVEQNVKNQKIRNTIIEGRKLASDVAQSDLNLEFITEFMGESGKAIKDFVIDPMVAGKEESLEWQYDSIDKFEEIVKKSKMKLNGWSHLQYGGWFGAVKDKDLKRVDFKVPSTGETIPMTYDEAANFLRVARDPDGFDSLVNGGLKRKQNRTTISTHTLSEDDVMQMIKQAPEDVRKFAFEVGDQWFNDYEFQKLNELGNDMLGRDIAIEGDTYTHLKKDGEDAITSTNEYASVQDILNRNGHTSPRTGSMKTRQEGAVGPIVIEGMTEAVLRSSHEHGVFAGFGKRMGEIEYATKEIAKNLNEVGAEAIADRLSKKVAGEMSTSSGKYSSLEGILGKLRGAYTVGKLGFRLGSALVQNTSILLYPTEIADSKVRHKIMTKMPEAMAKSWAKATSAKFDVEKAFKDMIDKSPMMRKRLEGGFAVDLTENSTAADVKRFLAATTGDKDAASKIVRKLSPETAMGMIRFFDAMAMYQGWLLAQEQVKEETDLKVGSDAYWDEVRNVHNQFSRKTQPTSDSFDRTGYQDAPGLKQILMFASFRSKLWQVMRKGAHQIQTGDVAGGVETLALVVTLQLASDMMKQGLRKARGKEAPEEKEDWVMLEVANLLRSNVLVGDLLEGLVLPLINDAANKLTGEDFAEFDSFGADKTYIYDIKTNITRLAEAIREGDEEKRNKYLIKLSAVLKLPLEGLIEYGEIAEELKEE